MQVSYDIGIIGAGLAGLAAAIELAEKGYKVILIEKEHFPFHKVCGEYISNESRNYLERLGLDMTSLGVAEIKKFSLSNEKGNQVKADLGLGGIGISRYKLDDKLAQIALDKGVILLQGLRVESIEFNVSDETHSIHTRDGVYTARVVLGAFGKRSKLDKSMQRKFMHRAGQSVTNYVGIKYHVRLEFPEDLIELHLFPGGYCGISKVEDDRYCLCYLSTSEALKERRGNIELLEEEVLSKNPRLKERLSGAKKLYSDPLSISQIEFGNKETVKDHVLFIGDAAGMITPLTGNGMSMALRSSHQIVPLVDAFLRGSINRRKLEQEFSRKWKALFAGRVSRGRQIQKLFYRQKAVATVMQLCKVFPFLLRMIIRSTHGKPF